MNLYCTYGWCASLFDGGIEMTLPPLPEPRDYIRGYGDIYTEAQLLAYRDAVVEACAVICDEHLEYPSLTPKHCADAIRSMK